MNEWMSWAALDHFGFAAMRLLLTALWQSSILLAAVGVLTWLLRRRRASVRHALWVGGLVVAPLLPFITAAALRTGAPQAPVRVLPVYVEPLPELPPIPPIRQTTASPASVSPSEHAPIAETPRPRPTSIFVYRWAFVLIAYGAGVVLFVAWFAACRLRIRHWLKSARPLMDERVLSIFNSARDSVGLRRDFVVLESARVPTPVSLGALHPVVLVPKGLVERLTDAELRALAVHELAHIRRNDAPVLSLLALVRGALFFHPLVWLATRQAAALAEQAADDAVLDATGEPISYAKLLARLAEELPRRVPSISIATGIVFSRNAFLRRVEAILSDRAKVRRLSRWALAGTLAAAAVTIAISCALPLGEKPTQKAPGPDAITSQPATPAAPAASGGLSPAEIFSAYAAALKPFMTKDSGLRLPTPVEIAKMGSLWPKVPPDENAAVFFEKAYEVLDKANEHKSLPAGSISSVVPYAGDAASLDQYVLKNRNVLATIQEGLSKKVFQIPILIDQGNGAPVFTLVPAESRGLAWFVSDAGFAAELQGDPNAAAERYLECLRMGKLLMQDANLISYQVGEAIESIGADGLERLVANTPPDAATLEQIIAVAREMETTPQDRAGLVSRESEFAKAVIALTDNMAIQMGYAGAAYRASYRSEYDECFAVFAKEALKPMPEILQSAAIKKLMEQYPAGKDPHREIFYELGRMPRQWAQQDLRLRVLQIRAAIALYQKAEGRLPDRLDALVPRFLPAAPTDPFSGKAIGYARTADGWKVWGLGEPSWDHGGTSNASPEALRREGPDLWGGPDYVFVSNIMSNMERRSYRREAATASAWLINSKVAPFAVTGVPLPEALALLKKQAPAVNFVIYPSARKSLPTVTVDLKDVTLAQALNAMLKGTKLTYSYSADNIICILGLEKVFEQSASVSMVPGQLENQMKFLGQKITSLSLPGVSLPEAIETLKMRMREEKLQVVNFLIDPHELKHPLAITLELNDLALDRVLWAMLLETNLNYVYSDRTVFISSPERCQAYADYVSPTPPEGPAGERLRALLEQKIPSVSLSGVTLPKAADILKAQLNGLAITIDPACLATPAPPTVNLDLKDVTVRVLLKNMLAPLGLDYRFDGYGIVIKEKSAARAETNKPPWGEAVNGGSGDGHNRLLVKGPFAGTP